MLEGRPLYDTAADRRYYLVPTLWDTVMHAIDRRNNVLIAGKRGSGKTSLLRQAQLALRNGDEPVAFVDANTVGSASELAARLRAAAGVKPSADEEAARPENASQALLLEIERLGDVDATTFLVDASGSGEAVHGLFGRQRDTLWRLPHHYVVTVDEDERVAALRPPADAFFDTVLTLEPMSTQAVVEMLGRRDVSDELDSDSVIDIAAASGGSPRAALRAANAALVSGESPSQAMSERGELLAAAARLGRPYGMLMSELLDLGQASPSDEALQARLGLTRGRITHLLRRLLEAGLVESGVDKTETPGRPRTIYRPKLEVES